MTLPRAVQLPSVAMPHDSERVCLRFPIAPSPDAEYYEMELTHEEAQRFGLAVLCEAERAAYMVKVNKRLRKSAERRQQSG